MRNSWMTFSLLAAIALAGCSKKEAPQEAVSASSATQAEATVDLEPSQLNAIKIEPVGTYRFPVEKEAVGDIDYDEDLSVQVFPPDQGNIVTAFAYLGDDVQKGQPLYTIANADLDLIQAETVLIAAVANLDLTGKELARLKDLSVTNGVSEQEIQQATAAQQKAEAALKSAREAVRVFGRTEADVDEIVATRKVDTSFTVLSPVTGRVIARNAQPGLFVQPGNTPAPYSVADLSTKWMVANVTESDSPLFQVGQPVEAKVMAWLGRVFNGRISTLGAAVDPSTHRVMVRCEIADPKDELRPGMLATFTIRVQDPVESIAIPMTGVVWNGDGTMATWVTTDRHRFSQRIIKIGLQRDGQYQVLEGLQPGELAVTDGAVFISNILFAPPTD
ncbi:MAG: efflux RND transporter periplasmic adaptor subunit [Verrucomicrobiia bacterium]